MEKTIFLIFMFVIGGICLLLNFLEINYLGWKRIKHYITVKEEEMFIQPSVVLGTYAEIMDAAIEYPIHRRHRPNKRKTKVTPSAPPAERVIHSKPKQAPPGYGIYPQLPEDTKPQRYDKKEQPKANLSPKHMDASSVTSETEISSYIPSGSSNASLVKISKKDII